MKTNNPIAAIFLLCAIFLPAGCAPDSAPALNEYSGGYSTLNSKSMGKLRETASWQLMDYPVSLIKYNYASNSLIAVNEENKKIVRLDIWTGTTTDYEIENVSSFHAIGFDTKGDQLMGARSNIIQILGQRGLSERLDEFAIWDANSGILILCRAGPCGDSDRDNLNSLGISADLDDGIFVYFDEDGYSLSTQEFGGSALVNSPDADYWWSIGNIAIDSRNERLAVVYQEGRIELDAFESFTISGLVFEGPPLKWGEKGDLQQVHAALFDRTGKWLAIVRGDQLSIWDVGGWFKRVAYRETVGAIHGISFSPSGGFLFLGVDDKIKIINLDRSKQAAELEAPNITSLDISEDNRLLFWSDENGVVHLWSFPQTQ